MTFGVLSSVSFKPLRSEVGVVLESKPEIDALSMIFLSAPPPHGQGPVFQPFKGAP